MKFIVLTLFPEMFPGPLSFSVVGKAIRADIITIECINIRDFAINKLVDDVPYGGGPGMVMRPDVLGDALDCALSHYPDAKIMYTSPSGAKFTQKFAKDLSIEGEIIIICGRFEGIDYRIIEKYNVIEVSIGDYILSGGELAAMVIIESCARLLPGTLGNAESQVRESFTGEYKNLLEYPQYTRPRLYCDMQVPGVLLSGNHVEIRGWRMEMARALTADRRPDLWQNYLKQER